MMSKADQAKSRLRKRIQGMSDTLLVQTAEELEKTPAEKRSPEEHIVYTFLHSEVVNRSLDLLAPGGSAETQEAENAAWQRLDVIYDAVEDSDGIKASALWKAVQEEVNKK